MLPNLKKIASLARGASLHIGAQIDVETAQKAATVLPCGVFLVIHAQAAVATIKAAAMALSQGAFLDLHPQMPLSSVSIAAASLNKGACLYLSPLMSYAIVQSAVIAMNKDAFFYINDSTPNHILQSAMHASLSLGIPFRIHASVSRLDAASIYALLAKCVSITQGQNGQVVKPQSLSVTLTASGYLIESQIVASLPAVLVAQNSNAFFNNENIKDDNAQQSAHEIMPPSKKAKFE